MEKFHTDPLQAAYMARDYGVKFERDITTFSEARRKGFIQKFGKFYTPEQLAGHAGSNKASRKDRYYVHPDSYSIYEPQVGDGFSYKQKAYGVMFCDTIKYIDSEYEVEGYCATVDIKELKTIQRNNKPFFTPTEAK
jgi:hypothetical protein